MPTAKRMTKQLQFSSRRSSPEARTRSRRLSTCFSSDVLSYCCNARATDVTAMGTRYIQQGGRSNNRNFLCEKPSREALAKAEDFLHVPAPHGELSLQRCGHRRHSDRHKMNTAERMTKRPQFSSRQIIARICFSGETTSYICFSSMCRAHRLVVGLKGNARSCCTKSHIFFPEK